MHTTLRIAKVNDAREGSYVSVRTALGKGWGLDDPIPLSRILEMRGLYDALWCLRAVLPEEEAARDKLSRLLACDYVEHVAHMWKAPPGVTWKPSDNIEVARRYAHGEATDEELTAARDIAKAVAWDIAWDIARDVAWVVAVDVAGDAEIEWQAERFLQYLNGEVE